MTWPTNITAEAGTGWIDLIVDTNAVDTQRIRLTTDQAVTLTARLAYQLLKGS